MRKEVSTKLKIPVGYTLHPEAGIQGRTKLASRINQQIRAKRSDITDKIQEVYDVGGKITHEKVINYVLGKTETAEMKITFQNILIKKLKKYSSDGRTRSHRKQKVLAPGTISYRLVTVKKIMDLCGHLDLDFEAYNGFTTKIHGQGTVKLKYDNLISGIKDAMLEDKIAESTIEVMLTSLKRWITEICLDADILIGNRLDSLEHKAPKKPVIVITQKQFEWIMQNWSKLEDQAENMLKSNVKNKLHPVALPYLAAGLLTFARVSDMDAWTKDNLHEVDDMNFLIFKMIKTRNTAPKTIKLPVNDFLMQIFRKNMFKYNGKLLPPWNRQLSKYLRDIMKLYDVFKTPVMINDEETALLCDVFHIHITRATAITLALRKPNMTPHKVKQFSGHSENSKSFQRYIADAGIKELDADYQEYVKTINFG